MFERRGTFEATDTSGNPHRVFVFMRIPPPPRPIDERVAAGAMQLLTSQNEAVNRIGKGEYVTLFGKRLVSQDPFAP